MRWQPLFENYKLFPKNIVHILAFAVQFDMLGNNPMKELHVALCKKKFDWTTHECEGLHFNSILSSNIKSAFSFLKYSVYDANVNNVNLKIKFPSKTIRYYVSGNLHKLHCIRNVISTIVFVQKLSRTAHPINILSR